MCRTGTGGLNWWRTNSHVFASESAKRRDQSRKWRSSRCSVDGIASSRTQTPCPDRFASSPLDRLPQIARVRLIPTGNWSLRSPRVGTPSHFQQVLSIAPHQTDGLGVRRRQPWLGHIDPGLPAIRMVRGHEQQRGDPCLPARRVRSFLLRSVLPGSSGCRGTAGQPKEASRRSPSMSPFLKRLRRQSSRKWRIT